MKKYLIVIFVFTLAACNGPEARRPVKVKTGSFFKESVERNKKLLALEEKLIQEIVEKDTLHNYQSTSSGSWYFYETKNEAEEYTPQPDDLVTLTYNLMSFDNDTIYYMEEVGVLTYKVDKQELFPGLRNSVKILKESETATFLFPSSLGYGYHGDNNKIGTNMPLKSTISILKIEKHRDSIQ